MGLHKANKKTCFFWWSFILARFDEIKTKKCLMTFTSCDSNLSGFRNNVDRKWLHNSIDEPPRSKKIIMKIFREINLFLIGFAANHSDSFSLKFSTALFSCTFVATIERNSFFWQTRPKRFWAEFAATMKLIIDECFRSFCAEFQS